MFGCELKLTFLYDNVCHFQLVGGAKSFADVFFCGSMFPERLKWFSEIDWSGIDFALYCRPEDLPKRSPLRQFLRGGVTPNQEMISLEGKMKLGMI